MPSIEELNKAIMTIKEECDSHSYCMECPLRDGEIFDCSLYDAVRSPRDWKPIEGGEQDVDYSNPCLTCQEWECEGCTYYEKKRDHE